VIGIYTVPFFLAEPGSDASLRLWVDHVGYVADLVGWQHVGVGTDWPPADDFSKWPESLRAAVEGGLVELGFRAEHGVDLSWTLTGFSDYLQMPNLTRGLVAAGFSDEQVEGILGENFLRVFQDVCG